LIGSEPMTVEAVVTHCASPKCLMGRAKGVPAAVDRQGITEKADRLWPVTTLADCKKVLKFCDLPCWHVYQQDQAKLPDGERDPHVGRILCTRCGQEIRQGSGNGLQGKRDRFCSVACVSQLALVYAARDRAAAEVTNRSLDARRTDLPEPKDAVDLKVKYEKDKHANLLAGPGKAVLWDLLMPNLDTVFEWRVELDCGCVHQAVTGGDDSQNPEKLLTTSVGYVFLDGSVTLPAGQRICHCRPGSHGPVRDIVEWVDRENKVRVIEPMIVDGEEILHESAYVSWYVLLDCGHVESVSTDPSWGPQDGFVGKKGKRRPRGEVEREFRNLYADDEHHLAYLLRLLDENWPEPAPFTNCHACLHSYYIVAYQPVGLVAPPPKPPRKPRRQRSREEILREQVKRAERELSRLREELKDATPPPSPEAEV
jgi:hypothetical protein